MGTIAGMYTVLTAIADPRALPLPLASGLAGSGMVRRMLAFFAGGLFRGLAWAVLLPLLWHTCGPQGLAVLAVHQTLSLAFAQWPRLVAAEWATRLRADWRVGDTAAGQRTMAHGLVALTLVMVVQVLVWQMLVEHVLPHLPWPHEQLGLLLAFLAADRFRIALQGWLHATLTLLIHTDAELDARAVVGGLALSDLMGGLAVVSGVLTLEHWPLVGAVAAVLGLVVTLVQLFQVQYQLLPAWQALLAKPAWTMLLPGPVPLTERPPVLASLHAFVLLLAVFGPLVWLGWLGIAVAGLDLALHSGLYMADQLAPLGVAPGVETSGFAGRRRFRRAMDATLIACGGLGLAVGVFGRPGLGTLLGDRKMVPAAAMVALGIALVTAAPGVVAAWQLQVHGRGRRVLAAAAADGFLAWLFGAALIGPLGPMAALFTAALVPLASSSLALPLAACRSLGIRFVAFWYGRLWRTLVLLSPASLTLALLNWSKPVRLPRDVAVHAAIALILYAIPAFAGWHLLDPRTERDLKPGARQD